jgi:hypothetical protein
VGSGDPVGLDAGGVPAAARGGRVDSDPSDAGLDEGAAGGGGHLRVFPALPHVAVQGGELGQGQGLGGAG